MQRSFAPETRLAKVVVIQAVYPELYRVLKETPHYLREIEIYFRQIETIPNDQNKSQKEKKLMLPSVLKQFGSYTGVRKILTMHKEKLRDSNFSDLEPSEIRFYFTLTRRIEPEFSAMQLAWQEALERSKGRGKIRAKSYKSASEEQEKLYSVLEKRIPTNG